MYPEEPTNNQDWWDDLNENQQQHINVGIADAENGRVVCSEDFWNILKMKTT